ncbi:MAG: TetR/AcrR family transcriptional regulator [Acidobacteriota bacterium]|nr:TetR/AcrR family transcriptional regulator [Acidobacteriota bacterium]
MPKVSAAHLDARRRGILAAAQRCVARSGVAAPTMRDICRAANLSPGGVYRYFSGKDDILAALAAQRQTQVEHFFRHLGDSVQRRGLRSALRELATLLDGEPARDSLQLDLHLASAALVSPRVHDAIAGGHRRVGGKIAGGLAGTPPAESTAAARALLALLQGMALQKALEPDLDLGAIVDGLIELLSD